jgi:hypothetical protein
MRRWRAAPAALRVYFNCAHSASPPSMRFRLLRLPLFRPKKHCAGRGKILYFRRTAGTAIKVRIRTIPGAPEMGLGCRVQKCGNALAGTAPPVSAKTDLCTVFLYLTGCLPPFEARLASRFAAATVPVSPCMSAARTHGGRPRNPRRRDGPENYRGINEIRECPEALSVY